MCCNTKQQNNNNNNIKTAAEGYLPVFKRFFHRNVQKKENNILFYYRIIKKWLQDRKPKEYQDQLELV